MKNKPRARFHSKKPSHSSPNTQITSHSSQNTPSTSIPPPAVTEFAGNASNHSYDPSNPSSPLQVDADFDWLPDTGATSHMTPHRHWLRNYKPIRIPVRLADHSIVYTAGIGSVVFQPVVEGRLVRAVEWSRVLHVPDLRTNLLSCLYLTRQKGYTITITASHFNFHRPEGLLFTATTTSNCSAVLNGTTVPPEAAASVSTIPVDLSLLHRRLCHHNIADIKKLLSADLGTGLTLQSSAKPDPICEPCLAGKMKSISFPSTGHVNSTPLELVHTDLHGPLPVSTREGYRYWIIFIDGATRFRVGVPLK